MEKQTEIQSSGIWSSIRERYLKAEKPRIYQEMLKNNQLTPYLKKLDREYDNKFSTLVDKIMKKENIPENLTPGYPQMKWVGEVNNIRNRAKEILTAELCQ
ncbi:TnpV protein [Pectinatus frisingensis]|uniref:TnpV protein n=1 Tax=Pectinatus frisingensis TaxID=865 RepID=UPI0018C741CA